ncbi:MAG: GntR family transcriptional regulator [Erysipelotrichaceae bacterium]|nr:GntR family transcriptional regulator [Erysipelotrichaceae bacterium]
MQIQYSHQDKDPIYLQIVKQIKVQIMNGTLVANQPLPSMRALASELRISVITTKRAYEELEKEGFITSVVGKGCFVSGRPVDSIIQEHHRQLNDAMNLVIEAAKALDLSADDVYLELRKRGF